MRAALRALCALRKGSYWGGRYVGLGALAHPVFALVRFDTVAREKNGRYGVERAMFG